jgi:hypothetical protein
MLGGGRLGGHTEATPCPLHPLVIVETCSSNIGTWHAEDGDVLVFSMAHVKHQVPWPQFHVRDQVRVTPQQFMVNSHSTM